MASKTDRDQSLHHRGATVLDGDLKDWVVVAIGTRKELESGKVGKYRMDIDPHCTNSCPGKH